MSWTGIKKAINRAGNQVFIKVGQIETSTDLAFEYEEKRYRNMESKSKKLEKEFKMYLDSLKIMTSEQVKLGEILSSFYGNNETEASIAKEYYRVMKLMNQENIKGMEQPYYQTVINPMDRFKGYFHEVNEAIKKRNHKKIDYDALRAKVKKLSEENDPTNEETTLKLDQHKLELKELETKYQTLNENLKNELPKFVNLRIPYMNPLFESFVKLQLNYFNQSYVEMNKLQNQLDMRTRQDYTSGKLEARIDDVLQKMGELNITGFS